MIAGSNHFPAATTALFNLHFTFWPGNWSWESSRSFLELALLPDKIFLPFFIFKNATRIHLSEIGSQGIIINR